MKYFTLMILFVFLFNACKPHHDVQSEDPLYLEVMAIHDDVMPKMSTMHHYKKELKKQIDLHPEWRDSVLSVVHILDEADESMMNWMAEFSLPAQKDQVTSYLESEKIKIQKVSDDMYSSMELAKTLLDSLQK